MSSKILYYNSWTGDPPKYQDSPTKVKNLDCSTCTFALREDILFHDGEGVKHPIHKPCLQKIVESRVDKKIVICPDCRQQIDVTKIFPLLQPLDLTPTKRRPTAPTTAPRFPWKEKIIANLDPGFVKVISSLFVSTVLCTALGAITGASLPGRHIVQFSKILASFSSLTVANSAALTSQKGAAFVALAGSATFIILSKDLFGTLGSTLGIIASVGSALICRFMAGDGEGCVATASEYAAGAAVSLASALAAISLASLVDRGTSAMASAIIVSGAGLAPTIAFITGGLIAIVATRLLSKTIISL